MNLEKIKAVDVGNYYIHTGDAIDLVRAADGNAIMTAFLAYRYGFMRGQNAEKAKRKAAKK